jgi:putative redox protein
MSMKARIKWIENVAFVGETESGHAVVMDGSPEAVLIGAGACSAFDVIHILKKGREPVTDCVVELSADRADVDPKVFTRIHFHYVVTGKSLDHAKVARAIQLSADKYCSATAMLAATVNVTHDFELVNAS